MHGLLSIVESKSKQHPLQTNSKLHEYYPWICTWISWILVIFMTNLSPLKWLPIPSTWKNFLKQLKPGITKKYDHPKSFHSSTAPLSLMTVFGNWAGRFSKCSKLELQTVFKLQSSSSQNPSSETGKGSLVKTPKERCASTDWINPLDPLHQAEVLSMKASDQS